MTKHNKYSCLGWSELLLTVPEYWQ